MHRLWLALVLILAPLLTPSVTAIRPVYVPVNPPTAFVAVTDGFAAPVESAKCGPGWLVDTDTTADGGSFTSLPADTMDYQSQCALSIDVTCDYLWVKARTSFSGYGAVWFATSPFPLVPSNTSAWRLFGGHDQPTFVWSAVGQRGDENLRREPSATDTAQRDLNLTPGSVLYFTAQRGVELDSFFCSTNPAADPVSPAGGESVAVNYDVKQVAAEVGCTADEWTDANVIAWTGYDTTTRPAPTAKLLYHAASDRLFLKVEQLDTDLRVHSTAVDTGDGAHLEYRTTVSGAPRDAETFLLMADVSQRSSVFTYPGGVTTAHDPGLTLTVINSGTLDQAPNDTAYTMCFAWDAGFDLTPDATFSGDLRTYQRDSTLVGYRTAFGTVAGGFSDPATWGVLRLSATFAVGAPVSGAPTVGSLSFPSVTASSVTTTFSTDQSGSCAFQYDTDVDEVVAGTDASAVLPCGPSASGSCTCTASGLSASTTYQVQGRVTNAQGQTGLSALNTVQTSAAGVTRYLSPSGTDSGACTSSGAPCKTFAYALPLLNPGETLLLQDGTYTQGTTGRLLSTCGGSGPRHGTPTQRITVKAQNERLARIQGAAASGSPGVLTTCQYWTIEGVAFEMDGSTYAFWVDHSPNTTLRRNYFWHNNSPNSAASVVAVHASDGSVFEENEAYYSSRHMWSLKWNHSGTFRRNYINLACAPPVPSGTTGGAGGPREGFTVYPSENLVFENNIADAQPCGGSQAGFSIHSYGVRQADFFPSDQLRFYGNMCLGQNNCLAYDFRSGSPAGSIPLAYPHNSVYQDFVSVGGTNGLWIRSPQGTGNVFRRLTAIGGSGVGVQIDKWGAAPASEVYTAHLSDILVLNQGGWGIRVSPEIDVWSVTDGVSNGNGTNLSATSNGQCTNCTGVVTTDPGIGTRKVYTGLTVGAEILYATENEVLNPNKKLWVTTAPSGWTGTSHERYFRGCGRVLSGTPNSVAGRSCADAASRLSLTTGNLPSGF